MGPGWVRIIGQKSCDTVPLIQKEYKLSFLPTLCPPSGGVASFQCSTIMRCFVYTWRGAGNNTCLKADLIYKTFPPLTLL